MSERRWMVRAGDGTIVGQIAARAAADDPRALAEGRVFVGRERVTDAARPIAVGETLVVHSPRASVTDVTILAEHDGVIAADKPASLATIADHRGTVITLLGVVARMRGLDERDVSTTSRLDIGVSGVVLITTTRAARVRLADARAEGRYHRRYLAIASAVPIPAEGRWDAAIGRAADPRYRAVDGHDATHARTRYRTIAEARGGACLLALSPETGRTHQLRVHTAHAGAPLLGDVAYRGPGRLVAPSGAITRLDRVALHARSVSVPDARGGTFEVASPVPDTLLSWWTALDGDPSAWERAAWP